MYPASRPDVAEGVVGPQTITVTAYDANGEVDTGYDGTVNIEAFCMSACVPADPLALVPDPYTYAPEDAGVHTFEVTIRRAPPGGAAYVVRATDAEDPGRTGRQTAWIGPGPAVRVVATPFDPAPLLVIGQAIPKSTMTVEAFDQYDNYANNPELRWAPDFVEGSDAPDNYEDLLTNYPTRFDLIDGQATITLPTPGKKYAPGVVSTIFNFYKIVTTPQPGTLLGNAVVVVTTTAPNLDLGVPGGFFVDDDSLHISGDIIVPSQQELTVLESNPSTHQVIFSTYTIDLEPVVGTMYIGTPLLIEEEGAPGMVGTFISADHPQIGDTIVVTGTPDPFRMAYDPNTVSAGQGTVVYNTKGGGTRLGVLFAFDMFV